jgi:hypothetical protein
MKRPHMPLSVKLAAALHALGLEPTDTQYDHDPALAMRPIDPVSGDTIPPANDPRYIVPRTRADHRAKTFGSHVPLSGDVSKIRKLQRIERKQAKLREKLLAKDGGALAPRPAKPKRTWPKRGFPKKP